MESSGLDWNRLESNGVIELVGVESSGFEWDRMEPTGIEWESNGIELG